MSGLPADLAAHVLPRLAIRFGPQVQSWCSELPGLVTALADEWQLQVTGGSPPGSNSVLFTCLTRAEQPAILKLTPDPRIAADEAAALTVWRDSPYVVGLLTSDPARGALLLDQVLPGSRLADTPEDWRLGDVLPMLAALRAPTNDRPTLPDLSERMDFVFELTARRRPQAADLIERSRVAARWLASEGPVGLVHGDLHASNVLRGPAGVVAIDPRPCWGDQTSDLVDWVLVGAEDDRAVERRIGELVDGIAGLDSDRLWAWCESMAVVIAASILNRRPGDRQAEFLLRFGGDR